MNKQFQLVFKNNVGKKLTDYLIVISVIGGTVMVFGILTAVLFVAGVFGGILFSSAGRVVWLEAWIVTISYAGYLLSSMIWGSIHAPELMRERSRMAKNIKSWDKRVNLLVVLLLVALLIVAGLVTRYGMSSIPVVLKWLGALGMIGTSYATWLTMRENPFISRWARIQDDRQQAMNVVNGLLCELGQQFLDGLLFHPNLTQRRSRPATPGLREDLIRSLC